MNILGIGPLELLAILVIALLVLDPSQMDTTGKTIGKTLNSVIKSDWWQALRTTWKEVSTLPNRLAREAELDKLDELLKDNKIQLSNKMPSMEQNPFAAWTNPSEEKPDQEEKTKP